MTHVSLNGIHVDPEQPHQAWEQIAEHQTWFEATLPIAQPDQPRLRFVCISDTHNQHDAFTLPEGDVLIHAGDFTGTGTRQQTERFLTWFCAQPHPHKILVAGNHELTLDAPHYEWAWLRFHRRGKLDDRAIRELIMSAQARGQLDYLHDRAIEIAGVKLYGSPYQPEFCGWAFNLNRGPESQAAWSKIPSDTDILITHGPPLGHGDLLAGQQTHCGCVNLLAELQQRVQPAYHIFGHIHEGYGVTSDGVTAYINASSCDADYRPVQPPLVFDWILGQP